MNKIKITIARIEIAKIIERNLPLMKKNINICQDIADAILLYMIEGRVLKK